jgi:hypothetical protein
VAPEPHENLQVYISATCNVVIMVIVIERGESSTNCKIMKFAYALQITSRKLSHYFLAHQIEVHTSSPLREILNNREATEKIAKWDIELSMYDIVYKPRTAMKAHVLSIFVPI